MKNYDKEILIFEIMLLVLASTWCYYLGKSVQKSEDEIKIEMLNKQILWINETENLTHKYWRNDIENFNRIIDSCEQTKENLLQQLSTSKLELIEFQNLKFNFSMATLRPYEYETYNEDGYAIVKIKDGIFMNSCGTSMLPAITNGATSIMREINSKEDVKLNSFVSYSLDGVHGVYHQVIELREDCAVIKGLNNPIPDGCIPYENINYEAVGTLFTGYKG